MIPPEQWPFKVAPVGDRLPLVEAYRRDLDFWGNGERKLYHVVTKSLAAYLVEKCSLDHYIYWCDIGCGPGYFLEGVTEVLRAHDRVVLQSGVDISSEALARCHQVFELGNNEFVQVNLDEYKRSDGNLVMPWINADVISFIDTLQFFKDYRRTFKEIVAGLRPGTVVVVADGMVRSNLRDFGKTLDGLALQAEWTDYSTPVTARDPNKPGSKNLHLKYRIYRKIS